MTPSPNPSAPGSGTAARGLFTQADGPTARGPVETDGPITGATVPTQSVAGSTINFHTLPMDVREALDQIDAPTPALRREAVTSYYEQLLADVELPAGMALCATGSFARREMTKHSDIDLMLLHDGSRSPEAVAGIAEGIWYPLWDRKISLDHSVRTIEGTAETAAADMTAALALLDLRLVRGDEELAGALRTRVFSDWRRLLPKRFDALVSAASSRWHRSGSVVAMTHPDLKHGRGGLRDYQLLKALSYAQVANMPDLTAEYTLLLDVLTLLHEEARRSRTIVDPEFAADIAIALGEGDRYSLAEHIASAARSIDAALTVGLSTARDALPARTALRRQVRKPLDEGVVDHGGVIALAKNVRMDDPGLPLRVAASAARTGLPVPEAVWQRLTSCPPLPHPWPSASLADFLAVLAAGPRTNDVVDALDRHGLWEPLVPGWGRIRGMMPRERSHILTLDKHALAVVEKAAKSSIHTARPDLLLVAALYHDLGKGLPEEHAVVGAGMVADASAMMGFNHHDQEILHRLVLEHITLMRLAVSRDPSDPETIAALLEAVDHSYLTLSLLECLTAADAQGTGPGVWTQRAASSVARLAQGAKAQLHIAPIARPDFAADVQDLKETTAPIEMVEDTHFWRLYLDDSSPDALARCVQLMQAKRWHVLHAQICCDEPGEDGQMQTVAEFAIHPVHAGRPDNATLNALYRAQTVEKVRLPFTEDDADMVWQGDILELRSRDRLGVLAAVVGALPELRWAKVSTFADTVVDQFCVRPGMKRAEKNAAEKRVRYALGDD